MSISLSKKLRLECGFTGAQKLSVTWYKDGKQLTSDKYNMKASTNSCVLECLHRASKETTGLYSCELSNTYGKAICHAQITAESGLLEAHSSTVIIL